MVCGLKVYGSRLSELAAEFWRHSDGSCSWRVDDKEVGRYRTRFRV